MSSMKSIMTILAWLLLVLVILLLRAIRNLVRPWVRRYQRSEFGKRLRKDLDTSIDECEVLFGPKWHDFPGEVQEIVVNMMFNMGRPRLSKFKNFCAALEEGDWPKAAVEGRDSRWHKQVTNRAERLMVRLENVS